MALSIFDIHFIVESIAETLSPADIQSCRQVNKQFAIILKNHIWKQQFVCSLLSDEKTLALINHQPWIQSLTISHTNLEKVSQMGFTRLQELVIYDQVQVYYFENSYRCSESETNIVTLLETNPGLKSLEINLSQYEYESCKFSVVVLMAIKRYLNLNKLVWYVPEYHDTHEFANALFFVCDGQKNLKDLQIKIREFQPYDCRMCCGQCSCMGYPYYPFRWRYIHQDLVEDLEVQRFKNQCFEKSVEQMGPFLFQKLILQGDFEDYYTTLLKSCPELTEVEFDFWQEDNGTVFEAMEQHSKLFKLNLCNGRSNMSFERAVSRFKNLETVCLKEMVSEDLSAVLDSLLRSSQNSLAVLKLYQSVTAEQVLFMVEKFDNLQEIDLKTIKIFIRNDDEVDQGEGKSWIKSGSRFFSPGSNLSLFDDCIVQDWDPNTLFQSPEPMGTWWDRWTNAKGLVEEISKLYIEKQADGDELRSISMQFQLSIKSFMSVQELNEYTHGTGVWEKIDKRELTVEDARRMKETEETEPDFSIDKDLNWARVWTPTGKTVISVSDVATCS